MLRWWDGGMLALKNILHQRAKIYREVTSVLRWLSPGKRWENELKWIMCWLVWHDSIKSWSRDVVLCSSLGCNAWWWSVETEPAEPLRYFLARSHGLNIFVAVLRSLICAKDDISACPSGTTMIGINMIPTLKSTKSMTRWKFVHRLDIPCRWKRKIFFMSPAYVHVCFAPCLVPLRGADGSVVLRSSSL